MNTAVALALLLSTQAEEVNEKPRLLVLELSDEGGGKALAAQASVFVADAITQQGKHRVMTLADLEEVAKLEKSKAVLGCEEDAECVARLSEASKAAFVVTGSLGKIGTQTFVTLALIVSDTRTVFSRVTQNVEGSLQDAATKAAVTLLGEGKRAVKFALPAGVPNSFAVLDMKTAGVTESVAKNLTQVLSTTLKSLEGSEVISRDDVYAMLELEKEKATLGCADDEACLAEIGGALGVEHVILGQVGQVAGSYVVSLRLVRAGQVVVENRVTETFAGSEDQLLNAVRHATRRLVGIDAKTPGGLLVSVSPEGAEVFVDGVARGTAPMKPLDDLLPGRHTLRVAYDHHKDALRELYIEPGVQSALFVELERTPDQFYETWWFWTGVSGVAVAAAAAATVGGAVYVNYLNQPFNIKAEAGLVAR